MGDDVTFEVETLGRATVIRPTGYLDVSTSPRLREKLVDLIPSVDGALILDLSQVDFIDSSALGVILHAWKLVQSEGSDLLVVSSQERITKIFEITALNLSVKMFGSTDEAVAAISAS